jgi:site-specific DNA-cytosine methylase
VDGAEEKIRLAEQKKKREMQDPKASVLVEPGRPIVITFKEGLNTTSVPRDAIISGEENVPGIVYYPPPIQVYSPAGNVVPSSISLSMLTCNADRRASNRLA